MGTHPGHKPNPIVRAKLFEILEDETARTIVKRTNDRACTQQWLIKNIDPDAKNRIGEIVRWLATFGLLDGSARYGYRLAVGELIDVFDLVQRSPMEDALWDTLSRPVGRAVLAALLHGERTRKELNELAPDKAVGAELRVLRAGHVVRRTRMGRVMWWTLLEPGRYAQILGGVDMIVSYLGTQLASGSVETVRGIAYPAGHVDDYEPAAREARRPPEVVHRPLSDSGSAPTANQLAAARIWSDLAHPGVGDLDIVALFKRTVPRIPLRPYPWADIAPQGTNYIAIPGVSDALLQSLPPTPSDEMDHFVYALALTAGTREPHPPPSPSQLRARVRAAIRDSGAPYSPEDLDLPIISWVGMHSASLRYAAEFNAESNELAINFGWHGLVDLWEDEWLTQPKSIVRWIEHTLRLRHALKLLDCIVRHEHALLARVPDAGLPQVTEDIINTAAHWTAPERLELRRVVNQHRSACRPKPGAVT